ncbi:hypothetical protein [Sharpea azabuensis]|uniref:hypothetical protein n=1 Tax=Sharpea azabuensis TaxID=322505 RepID=UPI00156C0480|nr:hypothetical protein [Sharpea azabuensis]
MKRRLKSLSLVLLAFLLSGCVKMNMTLDVSGNGKVKTSVRMLASTDTLKTSGIQESTFTQDLKKQFTKNNKDVSAHVIKDSEFFNQGYRERWPCPGDNSNEDLYFRSH